MRALAKVGAALLAFAAWGAVAATPVKVIPVTAKNADQVLKPGDIMLKLLNKSSQASSVGISVGEGAINDFYGGFSDAAKKGNPAAVHVAMYVGNGQTAEAHGKTSEDAEGVSLRRIEHHAGYLWFVFRAKDERMGREAADVARRWATARMAYRLPWEVAMHNSSFGSKAREEAFMYGQAANTTGGPPQDKSMFCSQFVIAAYQAAAVRRQMAESGGRRIGPNDLHMYPGVDLQASYTSPLVLHGHLQDPRLGFVQQPLVIVQKSQ